MLDFQVGQPLEVVSTTPAGRETYLGEFHGSDDTTLILKSDPSHWVYISRGNITSIRKISLLPSPLSLGPVFKPAVGMGLNGGN